MSSFWIGVGGVAFFFTLLILLPIIMVVMPKKKVAAAAPAAAATPPADPKVLAKRRKVWTLSILGLVGITAMWFFPPWTLFDWSTTLPGKTIDGWLGAGWSEWIMWLLIAILIYWLITTFILKPEGSKDGGAGSAVTVMAFIALAAIVFSAVGGKYTQEAKSTAVPVDLRPKAERDPVKVRINVTDTLKIQGKMVERSPGRLIGDGRSAYGFCAEIVEPAWLKKNPETPKQHLMFPNPSHIGLVHEMKLTDEMRAFLVQNEVTSVTVSVYAILTTVGIQGKC